MTKSYDICDSERVPIVMNWLGGEVFISVETLTDNEGEIHNSSASPLNINKANLNPSTMKLCLYYKINQN